MKGEKFKSLEQVLKHAKRLENKTLYEIIGEMNIGYQTEKLNKGAIGNHIERYFDLNANSKRKMDFMDYGLNMELKTTPIKKLKNGELRASDRLIIKMINYKNIIKEDYINELENSLFNILLVSYLKEPNKPNGEFAILKTMKMEIPEYMKNQIIVDYNIIRDKVLQGRAHELSGKDTVYLEAVTKRAGGPENYYVEQPLSAKKAKSRAFGLKNKAMNEIYDYNGVFEYKKRG